jgi:hypothetical protein
MFLRIIQIDFKTKFSGFLFTNGGQLILVNSGAVMPSSIGRKRYSLNKWMMIKMH